MSTAQSSDSLRRVAHTQFGLAVLVVVAVACGRAPQETPQDSAAAVAALRDTLVELGLQDQRDRDSVDVALARQDTAYMARMMRGDSTRTRWLQSFVIAHGWPRRSTFGDTAAKAAWLIVQHSNDYAFQEQVLPLLQDAAKANDVKAADVAMLADRVDMRRGRPQRYGTQFSLHNGMLVADSIADLIALDSLRATVGLPPMREYVKVLGDAYKLPVQWPPKRK